MRTKFENEVGFEVSRENNEITFFKKNEMYATVFYLRDSSLLLCRADMVSMTIPVAPEDRKKLTSPSKTIEFASNHIKEYGPKWQ